MKTPNCIFAFLVMATGAWAQVDTLTLENARKALPTEGWVLWNRKGMGGAFDGGAGWNLHTGGNRLHFAVRGVYHYRPLLVGAAQYQVEADRSSDSTWYFETGYLLGVKRLKPFGRSEAFFGGLDAGFRMVTFHADTSDLLALDRQYAGGVMRLSAGWCGRARNGLAFEYMNAFQVSLFRQARRDYAPELRLQGEAGVGYSLAGIWPRADRLTRGYDIFLRVPFNWNVAPFDPSEGQIRRFHAPRRSLGIRAGLSVLM